ncbi:MAG: hypothetical protein M3N37_01585 [Actinomycetota bacterium]|nr:hypothetical protein [Actinomycetota bacterium]
MKSLVIDPTSNTPSGETGPRPTITSRSPDTIPTTMPTTPSPRKRKRRSPAATARSSSIKAAYPDAEARLLQIAGRRELRELRESAARVRASAEDGAERAKRLHDQRSLRTWIGADGSRNLAVRNTPEMGAELEAALAPLRESIFHLARRAGGHQPGEAYGARCPGRAGPALGGGRRRRSGCRPIGACGRPAGQRGWGNGGGAAATGVGDAGGDAESGEDPGAGSSVVGTPR